MINRQILVTFPVSPRFIAEVFYEMDSGDQALFFSCLGLLDKREVLRKQWAFLESDMGALAKQTLRDMAEICFYEDE